MLVSSGIDVRLCLRSSLPARSACQGSDWSAAWCLLTGAVGGPRMTHMDANISRNRALSECGAEAELIHVSKRRLKFAEVRL